MPAGARFSSLSHSVKITFGAHLAAYSMGSVGAILEGKATGVGWG
jgi:hypothetical protein